MTLIDVILILALIGLGVYSHLLLATIEMLRDQVWSMANMIKAMARELKALGSPNVYIQDSSEKEETST